MNKPTLIFSILFLLQACSSPKQNKDNEEPRVDEVTASYRTTGSVERLHDEVNQLIPANAQIEILAEGFTWSEGPLWLAEEKMLVFSDVPENTVYSWKEGEEKAIYLQPSGYTGQAPRAGETGSNGLLLSPDGKLVLCQHGDRRVATMQAPLATPQATFSTLADNWEGKKFNSPNDAAFHQNGDLYFTDPPYGLPKQAEDTTREIDIQGVYRLDKTGSTILLTDELTRPNGIAFSPDYKTLYVANSDSKKAIWMAYDVKEDGTLDNGRVFFDATDMTAERKGLPDGLKVNPNGYIFATGPGGVLLFDPEGKHLGTILTGQATANCAFDDEYNYLYITADMYLMRIKLQ
ncbi:SMP-30/gluconolactonase/LRE family protein [Fulvivirgaceae bacterium BMA12]|uniref:SMP-30/gluconolactonase/LRE family protein n=1 Tax=Agaribacillus aureus TaxID=3051825 RepID=A0ABT8L0D5_9BACT|nr:SMP-30/gluconolactonase/LRE family protein [Fulvivirgaceae bacterium BMA12]